MSVCWVLSTLNHLTFKIANHSVALYDFNTFSTSEDRAAGYCISDVYDTLDFMSVYLQLFYSEN